MNRQEAKDMKKVFIGDTIEQMTEKWQPEIGQECEYETSFFTLDKFKKGVCSIIAIYKDKVWIDIEGSKGFVINLGVIEFRPLKTPEEVEREEFVETLNSIHNSLTDGESFYEELFNMGYRKK